MWAPGMQVSLQRRREVALYRLCWHLSKHSPEDRRPCYSQLLSHYEKCDCGARLIQHSKSDHSNTKHSQGFSSQKHNKQIITVSPMLKLHVKDKFAFVRCIGSHGLPPPVSCFSCLLNTHTHKSISERYVNNSEFSDSTARGQYNGNHK